MTASTYIVPSLVWSYVSYGNPAQLELVPADKRGIYAFTISHPHNVLPPRAYVLYIGIAGRDSDRPLRDRYKDYLNAKKVCKERPHIANILGNWHSVMQFFFAPIDDQVSPNDLKTLEKQPSGSLQP